MRMSRRSPTKTATRAKEEPMRRTRFTAAALLGVVMGVALMAASVAGGASSRQQAAGNVLFYSNQLTPVQEATAVRNVLLKGFDGNAEFVTAATEAAFNDRIVAEVQSGSGKIDLIGGLHGNFDFLKSRNMLADLSDVARQLQNAGIPKALMDLGKLGTDKQYYIPWMQATYLMAANKQALQYLPQGASVNKLTYSQLLQWAKNISDRTGRGRLGFPAGQNGLMHRFFQGYLVPAFSGGVVTSFKSPGASNGWQYLRSLWKYVHPQSLTYEFMQDPLLNGEVLVAWDHVARLKNALEQRPDDYVVFPAPRGPSGRAYMPVISGLAVPTSAPNKAGAKALIRHLLSLSTQAKTVSTVGFFPVVGGKLSKSISAGLRAESNTIKVLQKSPDALQSLLPIGLGAEGGNFNKVYRDVFTEIVLKNGNIASTLSSQGSTLQSIMTKTGAPCWKPDKPSTGACPVR
jgi:multiple sugar transport system substrate-binding protein